MCLCVLSGNAIYLCINAVNFSQDGIAQASDVLLLPTCSKIIIDMYGQNANTLDYMPCMDNMPIH